MVDPEKGTVQVATFTELQTVVAALKRLRKSYTARPVTGADRAVLSAVRSTLKNTLTADGEKLNSLVEPGILPES
jgi:hypothetical protein